MIIPTKGRAERLCEVLDSLNAQTLTIAELILVDDSPLDGFQQNEEIVSEFLQQSRSFPITHIKGRGKGAADARNQGAEMATGEILSFIDDDVYLEKDYYLNLVGSFGDPSVAGVTGVITNPYLPSRKWSLLSQLFFLSTVSRRHGNMRRSGYPRYLLDADGPVQVGVMSGCNMSLRRDVFLRFQFDPALSCYSYLEDADLSYRVSTKHRLLLNPGCRLTHNTLDKAVSARYFTIKLSYHRYVFKKNFGRNPVNYLPYALSVFADLLLIVLRARSDGEKEYVAAALAGLSDSHDPGRTAH